MNKDKLTEISEKLDDLLYLMETTLPSWACMSHVMNGLYGISDSLKELLREDKDD